MNMSTTTQSLQRTSKEILSMAQMLSPVEPGIDFLSMDQLMSFCIQCKKEKMLVHASFVLIHVHTHGLQSHQVLGSLLVSMLAECGSTVDASRIFNTLVHFNDNCCHSLVHGHVACGKPLQGLTLFQKMLHARVVLSSCTLVAAVKACSISNLMEVGQSVHCLIAEEGFEHDPIICNTLVDMYHKCGSLTDAQKVFNMLRVRDIVSWNVLLAGYAEYGLTEKLAESLKQMKSEGISPNVLTMLCCLKPCTKVEAAWQIHTEIVKEGFERALVIGNNLVSMYAKSGSFAEAEQVLSQLEMQDQVSWTALITGYADHGFGEKALAALEQMQRDGISPNVTTLLCSLKACGAVESLGKGQELHSLIVKDGFEEDPYIGNSLVDMYTKCCSLADAIGVFDHVRNRSVVSWTALIAGYVEDELGSNALQCLEQMGNEGVAPNATTYLYSLKASSLFEDKARFQELHVQVVKAGWDSEQYIGNTLVEVYVKYNSLLEASAVFDRLPARNVVSWNSILAGYAEHGGCEGAVKCLKQMREEGVSPNVASLIFSMKACGTSDDLESGRELHNDVLKMGLENDSFSCNSLVDMYLKCGLVIDAQDVFQEMPLRDVVSWTSLIAGYTDLGLGNESITCFNQMQKEGICLNLPTLVCALRACALVRALDKGQEVYNVIAEEGFEGDNSISNSLVNMYAKCGSLVEAKEVFDELQIRNVVSWTAIIAGYTEQGCGEEAINCLEQMQLEGLFPDATAFVCGLRACSNMGAVDKGWKIHTEIVKWGYMNHPMNVRSLVSSTSINDQRQDGLEATRIIIRNALIDMYCKCGSMIDAQSVFDSMPVMDLRTWNAMMTGYSHQAECEAVFLLFDKMMNKGIQPDEVTFLIVLNVCSHAGLIERGLKYFEVMREECGIDPTLGHYNCMVDLFGRAGQFSEAFSMLEKMPIQPHAVTWNVFLAACRKWGNVDLAKHAFDSLIKLDGREVSAFTLMSNVYVDAYSWEDTEDIEAMKPVMH